jgi:hypothetical protein
MPLDKKTRADIIQKSMERKEADQIMDRLLEDQEFREMFVRKVTKLSLKGQSI